MPRAIPGQRQKKRIAQHYRKSGNGRAPYPVSVALRTQLLHHWHGLSDPCIEDALYEIAFMCQFARLSLSAGPIPVEATIQNRRHRLEEARAFGDTGCQAAVSSLYMSGRMPKLAQDRWTRIPGIRAQVPPSGLKNSGTLPDRS